MLTRKKEILEEIIKLSKDIEETMDCMLIENPIIREIERGIDFSYNKLSKELKDIIKVFFTDETVKQYYEYINSENNELFLSDLERLIDLLIYIEEDHIYITSEFFYFLVDEIHKGDKNGVFWLFENMVLRKSDLEKKEIIILVIQKASATMSEFIEQFKKDELVLT